MTHKYILYHMYTYIYTYTGGPAYTQPVRGDQLCAVIHTKRYVYMYALFIHVATSLCIHIYPIAYVQDVYSSRETYTSTHLYTL